jgi:hypothetical protein
LLAPLVGLILTCIASAAQPVYVEDKQLSEKLIQIADEYVRAHALGKNEYTRKRVFDLYRNYHVMYSYNSLIDGILYRGGAPGMPRFLSVEIDRRTLKAIGHSYE